MKKSLIITVRIVSVLSLPNFLRGNVEEKVTDIDCCFERIDRIEIHVLSKKLDIRQNLGSEISKKTYPAATASRKDEGSIPYNMVGKIYKIVFNPTYRPTDDTRKEAEAKGKILPKVVPPGKDNPLGKIKLFISYNEKYSTLGIHDTDKPRSIGKRATHGCNRLRKKDMYEIANVLLIQNNFSPDEIKDLFEKAESTWQTIEIMINDGPDVVYLKN